MIRRTFDAACLRMTPLVGRWGVALALGCLGFLASGLIALYL